MEEISNLMKLFTESEINEYRESDKHFWKEYNYRMIELNGFNKLKEKASSLKEFF